MTDSSDKISGIAKLLLKEQAIEKTGAKESKDASVTEQNAIGQQEFLTLLVSQLQNQDPLNPLESEEFAVQLAQFSQVEQLIQINQKLSEGELGGSGSVSMMASFLGHEVVLNDQQVLVAGGKGPNVLVEIPPGTQSGRIDFLDAKGQVAQSVELENVEPGRQVVPLNGVTMPDGSYDIRVVAVNADGGFDNLEAKITGTVEGFVLEPEPALLINGEHVALEDVAEVYLGAG